MPLLHIRPRLFASVSGALFLAVGALAVGGLSGCGGGASPRPDNNGPFTVNAQITRGDFYDQDDDRYYDIFLTEPARDGRAQIDMESRDLDSEIFVYRRASNGDYDLIADDDNGGGGYDARVTFDVYRGEVYRIVATSSRAGEFGYYRLFFSRELGRPALVLPRVNGRTVPGLKLPPLQSKAPKE